MTMPVSAGMVFCVDVGIYVEEWGIGFRLESRSTSAMGIPGRMISNICWEVR